MAGLTPTGLEIRTQPELEELQKEALRANVSPTLNLSSTSIIGEHVGITSSHMSELWDALDALWQSWGVTSATGAALDRLAALTGTTRKAAQPSTVSMTLNLAAGTYPAGTLVVNLNGDANVRFSNAATITLASDDPALEDQLFESEEDGPVQAGAGQLTVITTPVLGFNSATNPTDALAGSFRESDSELRQRRVQELARRGSATVDAIRADVLQVTGVTFVKVIENDSDSTVNGIPPHAFETLVIGGDDEEIAAAIFGTKPAGIQAAGEETVNVEDSQGSGHNIGFTRPTDSNVYITVFLTYIGGQYVGDSSLKQIINDWGDANLGPGNDVIHARLIQVVMDVPGVVDVQVKMDTSSNPTLEQNIDISTREVARLDVSRIVVHATPVNGPP